MRARKITMTAYSTTHSPYMNSFSLYNLEPVTKMLVSAFSRNSVDLKPHLPRAREK